MTDARWRTRLERLIRQSDRTIDEWCLLFEHAAEALGERTSVSARQLQRWMAGEVDSARPATRRVATRLWGMDFPALLEPPSALDLMPDPVRTTALQSFSTAPAGLVGQETRASREPSILETMTTMAAHESSDHALSVSGEVNAAAIEHLQEEVRRLAGQFAARPPIHLLAETRRARDQVYAALDRTRRPAQTADLYLAAGQLCGLMSLASFDLAVWDAATEQARAAFVYADLVDHDDLRVWARGTQALIGYWTGQPRAALVHVEAGLAIGCHGVGLARLRAIEARALSQLGGDREDTYQAIAAADEAHDNASTDDDLYIGIGGEFGWGPSRHAACVSTALLAAGDPSAAAGRARAALDLLDEDPTAGLVRERAHVDLAAADLAQGHLDSMEADLEPVWALPVAQRRHALTDRMLDVSRSLTAGPFAGSAVAVNLRDQIEVFTTEAKARALPSSDE